MEMTREQKFGQLLAIANIISERIYKDGEGTISTKYLADYDQKPREVFERIHSDLINRSSEFTEVEIELMSHFDKVMASISDGEFTNEPIKPKYLHAYHTKQHHLRDIIGVDEASEI